MKAMVLGKLAPIEACPLKLKSIAQASADVAIVSLVSTAGEIALSLIVGKPEQKEMYLKMLNSAVEQVKKQLGHELKTRGI